MLSSVTDVFKKAVFIEFDRCHDRLCNVQSRLHIVKKKKSQSIF